MTENLEPVLEQLELALENDKFPAELHHWGTQLISHLRKPVQVAVVGLPKSGKSALINMILGHQIIPQHVVGVPVVEIAGGTAQRTMFETEDGSIIRINGALADIQIPPGTIRARQELPEPELHIQNYVEVNLPGDFGHQKSVVNWVANWADIILWCTERFDSTEQKLWMDVPEETKDHSCLVLTKADQQLMREVLADRISTLENLVVEEFLGLYPIATLQAAAARNFNGKFNATLWQSSGGKELIECLMRQVETGRTADLDQAQMLINQLPGEEILPTQSASTDLASDPSANESKREIKKVKLGHTQSHDLDTQYDQLLNEAIMLLQNCADELLEKLSQSDELDPEQILDQCVKTANNLNNILDKADSGNSSIHFVQDDVHETNEMMMLLRLEKGEDAAADAVTLLLQIKKEISAQFTT